MSRVTLGVGGRGVLTNRGANLDGLIALACACASLNTVAAEVAAAASAFALLRHLSALSALDAATSWASEAA